MTDNQSTAGKGMGITALVVGIVGVVCSFIPCFGLFALLFGALAIIFGAVGMSQAKKGGAPQGLPKAGLILGILATVFTIVWWAFFAASVSEAANVANELNNLYK